ncbi:MAG: EAL domain-containing protein [Lachnospiraceae bacterium]|nr:EAL domain-containing protein [Lachnospiraceae bacterium]
MSGFYFSGQSDLWMYVIGLVLLLIILFLVLVLVRAERRRRVRELEQAELLLGKDAEIQKLSTQVNRERDLKERVQQQLDLLQRSSVVDPLTELQNYYSLMNWIDGVTATIRKEEKIAILEMDIDDFKQINDELGHAYGDELLIDVAHRLMQILGEDDFLSRSEGDNFFLVTQNLADYSDFEEKIKKIQTVMNYPFHLAGREFVITLSMGICFAPQDGIKTRILLRNTDLALQSAKRNGKNTYRYYTAELEERSTRWMEQHAQLRTAIAEHEIVPWYDPCVDPFNETLVGFGVIIRWNHPGLGVVDFAEYEDLAESTNLSEIIGNEILREACLQLQNWNEEGYRYLLAVPLFFKQIREDDFIDRLDEILNESQIDPKQLVVEIREEVCFENFDRLFPTLQQIRERGIQVAMTEYGSKYGSLSILRQFPVQFLRLSYKLFQLEAEMENRDFLESVISVTSKLGVEVAADRIEEPEDEILLKKLNCHHARGLLYGEVLPAEKVRLKIDQGFDMFD